MIKKEFIRLYAKEQKVSREKAEKSVNNFLDVLEKAFRERGRVVLRNFGKFTVDEVVKTSGRIEKVVNFKKAEKMDLG